MSSNGGSKYFNPIPLFILFREAIEASIVVAVLLTFLTRASPRLKKHGAVQRTMSTRHTQPHGLNAMRRSAYAPQHAVAESMSRPARDHVPAVWWGVAAGIGISLVLAGVFAVLFYVAQNNVFTGKNLLIFKGTVGWVACIFITYLAFAMLRYEGWEAKWERKLAAQGIKEVRAKHQQSQQPPCDADLVGQVIFNHTGCHSPPSAWPPRFLCAEARAGCEGACGCQGECAGGGEPGAKGL